MTLITELLLKYFLVMVIINMMDYYIVTEQKQKGPPSLLPANYQHTHFESLHAARHIHPSWPQDPFNSISTKEILKQKKKKSQY